VPRDGLDEPLIASHARLFLFNNLVGHLIEPPEDGYLAPVKEPATEK